MRAMRAMRAIRAIRAIRAKSPGSDAPYAPYASRVTRSVAYKLLTRREPEVRWSEWGVRLLAGSRDHVGRLTAKLTC
jgi:hypothetical protein